MIGTLQIETDLPLYLTICDVNVYVADCLVRLNIEWDDSVAGREWYVESVDLYGSLEGGRDTWFALPNEHPTRMEAIKAAYGPWKQHLQERWEDHLLDEPVRHRSRLRVVSSQ